MVLKGIREPESVGEWLGQRPPLDAVLLLTPANHDVL